jgi:hypothetical protein
MSNSENLDTLLRTYTRLGRDLNRLVISLEHEAPELAVRIDSLITELHELTEPLGRLAVGLDEFILESSDLIRNLSGLLDMIKNDPAGLLIRTSGEGVWQ